jgi:hypothetical protein
MGVLCKLFRSLGARPPWGPDTGPGRDRPVSDCLQKLSSAQNGLGMTVLFEPDFEGDARRTSLQRGGLPTSTPSFVSPTPASTVTAALPTPLLASPPAPPAATAADGQGAGGAAGAVGAGATASPARVGDVESPLMENVEEEGDGDSSEDDDEVEPEEGEASRCV